MFPVKESPSASTYCLRSRPFGEGSARADIHKQHWPAKLVTWASSAPKRSILNFKIDKSVCVRAAERQSINLSDNFFRAWPATVGVCWSRCFGGRDPGVIFVRYCRSAARAPPPRQRCPAGGALELLGRPHRGQKRACELYVDVPEASGRATAACNLQGIARTSHLRGTCWREVCRGSADDDFDGPMTLPHVIDEGL